MSGWAEKPFVLFPERTEAIGLLIDLALRKQDPLLVLMPVETGGGKTRLCRYLCQEAGLPARAAISIRMGRYGPDEVVRSLLKALNVERPKRVETLENGVSFSIDASIPIEQSMKLLDTALEQSPPGLLLVDSASYLTRQQSVAATRAVKALLTSLIRRFGISIALMFCPDKDWPELPGVKSRSVHLGTIGDSPQSRAWLDSIQDGREGDGNVCEGRLTDPEVLPQLLQLNHGMLGFVEDDAMSLVDATMHRQLGNRPSLPLRLRERLQHPGGRREYEGAPDLRGRVFASLRRAYGRAS